MPEKFLPKDLIIPNTPDAQEIFLKNPRDIEKAKVAVSTDLKQIRRPNKKPRK